LNCSVLKEGFQSLNKLEKFQQSNTNNFEKDRKKIRDLVVDEFKLEKAGSGKGKDSTRVIYCVEQISEDEIIYLQRPAMLNKGFDFTVNVKNYQFKAPTEKNPNRTTYTPRHDSIIKLVQLIKKENKQGFSLMKEAIRKIYYCEEPIDILKEQKFLPILNIKVDGIKYETLLKVIKWLFIEQDVTYWSFSGRAMFYKGLQNV